VTDAHVLEVEHVSRAFGGVRAVQDLSFAVRRRTITALIGPNGAGKSTTLNVISGWLPATAGAVRFEGQELGLRAPFERSRLGIARTFQTPQLFGPLSALDNVVVGTTSRTRPALLATALRLPRSRVEDARIVGEARAWLDFVGLAGLGLARADTLAFGQLRLLEIARALAGRPILMLMDEPASGLSPVETDGLRALLFRIRDADITVLLVEHNMRLVMSTADRVVVLDKGSKLAEGSPDEVRADATVQLAYLGRTAGH
jgi:ABC-type branched-subunit amino acid transport system ATPase component